jgi:beta-galactosidase GanA
MTAGDSVRKGRMREVTSALSGQIAFGGDYNPEQWPERGRAADAEVVASYADGTWPAGLDAVRRHGPAGGYLFAINHGSEPVPVPAEGTDLVTGQGWTVDTTLAAGDLAVILEATAPPRD